MEDYIKNRSEKKWYKKWWGIMTIFFIIIILSTVVAFSFLIINIARNKPSQTATNVTEIDKETLALINGTGKNYWLGTADPKITIVEFEDFTCPHCQKAFSTIREIGNKYKNEVKITFRDLPIISEDSVNFALAARCAGEQGRFWLMYDKLFMNQGVAIDQIQEMAKQIGADMDKFNTCYNSQKYLNDVSIDYEAGKKLGLTGTPTWFINGQMIEGDIPYDTFIQIIENLLKSK